MDRRTFLKRGIWGGVLLAVGGSVGLALWPTRDAMRQPRRALRALDARQFAILTAVAGRMVQAPGADAVELAHRVDERLALAPVAARADPGKLLLLLENALAGLVLDGRPQPFTRRSPAAQDATLAQWSASRLAVRRTGYAALRKLTEAAWYGAPEAWPDTGYPGPPMLTVKT